MKKTVLIDFDTDWISSQKSKKPIIDELLGFMAFFYEDKIVLLEKNDSQLKVIIDFNSRIDAKSELQRIVINRTNASFEEKQVQLIFFENDENSEPNLAEKQKISKDTDKYVASRIESLVGCPEFKALINEICIVAPHIVKNKTFESFAFQNYLFSVNDGYGTTTYLDILSGVMSKAGLFKFTSNVFYEEIKLETGVNESEKAMFDKYIEYLSNNTEAKLVCFDISNFISKTDKPAFRDFLKMLEDLEKQYIFAFRIPFVEDDVLAKIQADISEVLFVRSISIAPFSTEDLLKCFYASLRKYGFDTDCEAEEIFVRRMSDEKSDGIFYGINTVNKIVNEIIYLKQLSNARSGKSDRNITAEDIKDLNNGFVENTKTAKEMLDELKGIDKVKTQLLEIVDQIEYSVKKGGVDVPCINMRFVGNPGTGKTTVARILGKLLRERGVLRNGNFFEYSGRDLCGRYIGETSPKTAGICRDAYGSVLFIDEAYSLYKSEEDTKDYGKEALTTLIAEMENHRNDLVVIMAGYTKDMEKLMEGNAGLESRMPYVVEFESYPRNVLADIFMSMVEKNFEYSDGLEEAVREYFDSLPDEILESDDFGNARYVRNMYEKTWSKAVTRCRIENCDNVIISPIDFIKVSMIEKSSDLNKKKKNKIGF